MDKTAIIVSAVVGSLGVLSALLGFIAEGANPYNPSPALGICASLFLLAAQITVSAVGGCCKSPGVVPSETNRIAGVVCAVVSWSNIHEVIRMSQQSKPDVHPVPVPADVVPIGRPQPQPVAVEGTVIKPREQPLPHTAGTTMQPQVPRTQDQVYTSHTVQPHVSLAPLPHGIKPENKQTGIGQQILKKGAEAGVELLVESLLSDNTGTDPLAMVGDAGVSMTGGTAGGHTGATGSGDASC